MTTFTLPWPNPDLDIRAAPPEGWDRVAVLSGWQDAKVARKRWPHAAVVGPLRTEAGIDLLVRGLLTNPQIRVLVWDGPDRPKGASIRAVLFRLVDHHGVRPVSMWNGHVGRDTATEIAQGRLEGLVLLDDGYRGSTPQDDVLRYADQGDRPGGAIFLPPPPPEPTTHAPHGDPGERIAGGTLAEVYPRMLDRLLSCGRKVPTHYGMTRELLNLVTVIRDPKKSLDDVWNAEAANPDLAAHPILGFSWQELQDYARTFPPNTEVPEGASYGYGARLAGTIDTCDVCPECGRCTYHCSCGSRRYVPGAWVDGVCETCQRPNQLKAVDRLLFEHPDTRAAWLTPWRPDEDCGLESNTPCMVGAWFRAVPADGVRLSTYASARVVPASEYTPRPGDVLVSKSQVPASVLHLTVIFRSHDMMRGYPLNLAAACLGLVGTAEKHGMQVGTLTCVSLSAHLYERDWKAAQDVIAKAGNGPVVVWDQRSVFRVEWVRYDRETLDAYGNPEGVLSSIKLRATALTPDGAEVIAVFEAPTPGKLLLDIGRSGLVTGIEHALWLGAEVERVSRGE